MMSFFYEMCILSEGTGKLLEKQYSLDLQDIAKNIGFLFILLGVSFIIAREIGVLNAAPGISATGTMTPLINAMSGFVKLCRVTMMFCAGIIGVMVGVMWFMGQQQAQGMLQKYFVAVFFIFGASTILDAFLFATIGSVKITTKAVSISTNW